VRHRDPSGNRAEQVVVVARAAARLLADLEAVGQGLKNPHHLVDRTDLGAAGDLPSLAEDADRDTLVVDIEPDLEHGCLLKSMCLGNAANEFQVTGLTGASFIVSTPTRAGRLAAASVDHTDARREVVSRHATPSAFRGSVQPIVEVNSGLARAGVFEFRSWLRSS
jgi:hypothetical protein